MLFCFVKSKLNKNIYNLKSSLIFAITWPVTISVPCDLSYAHLTLYKLEIFNQIYSNSLSNSLVAQMMKPSGNWDLN